VAGTANAGLVTLEADVGPITTLHGGSDEAVAGFLLGEEIRAAFTFDDATIDSRGQPDGGRFNDPTGTIRLTGKTSGATFLYLGGIEIEVDDEQELEWESLSTSDGYATLGQPNLISGDIDMDTKGTSFFSDPYTLTTVVSDLLASPFPNNIPPIYDAKTAYWNGVTSVHGMTFGPVPTNVVFTSAGAVPEPTTLAMFGFGAGVMGLVSIRRRRREQKQAATA